MLLSLRPNASFSRDRRSKAERWSDLKENLETLWFNMQRTERFEQFVLFCEQCVAFKDLLRSVLLHMRRTGLARSEKIVYSLLLAQVMAFVLFLVFG